MTMLKSLLKWNWRTPYEGDGGNPPPPPPPPPPPEEKIFKQADVDRIVAEARRKDQAEITKASAELKKLRDSSTTTEAQRQQLNARIQELEDTYKTAQQRAEEAAERQRSEHKVALESTTAERDRWKNTFHTTTIENAIFKASSDAMSVEQMHDLLAPKSRLVEGVDSEGKPNGVFTVMTKITVTDPKTKQATVIDVPLPDAIAQMKKDVPRYGNLFRSQATGGTGGSNGGGRDRKSVV